MAITVLSPDVAAKIAAGEVVERPASIVKEVIENAIDAGATRVTVEWQEGGVALLRVTDDGGGITRADLPLVFARHATSKLHSFDDFEFLHTLGFRGEAMASIGAVADVTVASHPLAESAGARMTVQHGEPGDVQSHAMPPGTIVTVRDLFARIPARRKFLKSRQGEAGACLQVVERYALAYPEIAFTAINDGRLALRTPGDGQLASAIAAVYDPLLAAQMIPIRYGDEAAWEEQSVLERPPVVLGMTSRPACFKASRQHVHLFVNRRWVRSQTLGYAVEEAYHSLLLTGRHPISVVLITVDPALVDVNVHPAKTEVKFVRERQAYAAVQRAVREAVIATTQAPDVSSHAFTVPEIPAADSAIPATRDDGDDDESAVAAPSSIPGPAVPAFTPVAMPHEVRGGRQSHRDPAAPAFTPVAMPPAPSPPPALWSQPALRQAARPVEQHHAATPAPAPLLPALRVLGQVSQSYIITEGPDGVYLIDQHAAHERIVLDRLVTQWRAQGLPAQALLEPVVVEASPEMLEAVEAHLEDLQLLSFDLELFGLNALIVRAVPVALAEHATREGMAELLRDLTGTGAESHGETWEEHALANVACRAAIKAGKILSPEEQRELVRQLEHVPARHSCCHGRPTTIHLSMEALEREFARR